VSEFLVNNHRDLTGATQMKDSRNLIVRDFFGRVVIGAGLLLMTSGQTKISQRSCRAEWSTGQRFLVEDFSISIIWPSALKTNGIPNLLMGLRDAGWSSNLQKKTSISTSEAREKSLSATKTEQNYSILPIRAWRAGGLALGIASRLPIGQRTCPICGSPALDPNPAQVTAVDPSLRQR